MREVLEEFLGYYDQLKSRLPALSQRLREALAEVYKSGEAEGADTSRRRAKKQVYKRTRKEREEGFS